MRTVLAPLALVGLGTPNVESLASYFGRLAQAHQVTLGQLEKVVCNDADYLRMGSGPTLKGATLNTAMLCSYSKQTHVLVQRLEKLTGARYLTQGTLLPLAGVLCNNQCRALTPRRRWCPRCYATALTDFAEPLAWLLPLITRCDQHHIPLEDHCRYCGAYQAAWRIGEQRRICCTCGKPLSGQGGPGSEWTLWDQWRQVEALKLLCHIATPDASVIEPSTLSTFVTALRQTGIPKSGPLGYALYTLEHGWKQRGAARALLETIFKLAALWGTSPIEILLRPVEAASKPLFSSDIFIPLPSRRPNHPGSALKKCKRRFTALLALPSAVVLPSAERVCAECHVNLGTFRLHHPDLWAAYVDKRSSLRKRQLCNRVLVANTYAENLLQELRRTHRRLHRKRAVARMMADIHVPKAIARSALRCALMGIRVERDIAKESPR